MPVDASFWRTLRQDFERLEIHKFSLVWSSTAHADQFDKTLPESHWSWLDYPDESWKARLSAIVLRGARALGFESEDDWYDELRRSEFVGFATTASSREKQSDGTFVDSGLGAIHDVVKESITLCYKLEADASSAPAPMAASDSKARQLTKVAMSRPARNEIERFANDAFAIARDGLLKEQAEKERLVLSQVRATRNSGAYLPALVKLRADQVRDTILALADAHVEAFTLCRTPSDAQAEKLLKTSAQQIAGGSISAVRGQLRLRSVRLRIPEEGQGLPWHLEIERSMDSALKEGLLRLRRQRIQYQNSESSLQRESPTDSGGGARAAVPTIGGTSGNTSKAEEIRPSTPQIIKKRGRPQKIADEKKTAALQLKASGGTNKEAAALLYDAKYPTPQQTKNVPAILRHHKLKSKQSSSPAERRKASPPSRKSRG